jgi:hypothetical protein
LPTCSKALSFVGSSASFVANFFDFFFSKRLLKAFLLERVDIFGWKSTFLMHYIEKRAPTCVFEQK